MKRLALLLLLAAAAPDPIVAVHGTQELTASALRALLADVPPEQRKTYEANPESLKALIRDHFLGAAILAEAQAQHWDERPEVVALAQRAHDLAITQSFLVSQSHVPAGYPSDAEVQAAWDANKAQLMQPRGYKLEQVLVTGAQDAAKKTLGALHAQLNHGHAALEAASKQVAGAQYADLGWVAENRLSPAAKDAVAGLLEGQITPPVCTAQGCVVLKLVATRPAGPAPLAEVKDQLTRALRQQKQRELQQAYANMLLAKQPVRVDEIQLSHLTSP